MRSAEKVQKLLEFEKTNLASQELKENDYRVAIWPSTSANQKTDYNKHDKHDAYATTRNPIYQNPWKENRHWNKATMNEYTHKSVPVLANTKLYCYRCRE